MVEMGRKDGGDWQRPRGRERKVGRDGGKRGGERVMASDGDKRRDGEYMEEKGEQNSTVQNVQLLSLLNHHPVQASKATGEGLLQRKNGK
ncbi:hypothetical protein ACH5RR_030549 [Cinchona calisaya]|uniref:Uncharacterized protein n=1 Tax=Cinchona calisaya TaxID=153742 RepID=A0ABD2YW33_9GENT